MRRRIIVAAVVALLVPLLATCSDRPAKRAIPTTTTTTPSTVALAPGSVGLAAAVSADQQDITVQVGAPTGASEMQLALDASFAGAPWSPVAATARLAVLDVGQQTVFARFRDAAGAAVGDVQLAPVTIDPGLADATASAGGGPHRAQVGAVASDVVSVYVESGRVVLGRIEQYDLASPRAGDKVTTGDGGRKLVLRDGAKWAEQVVKDSPWVRPFDVVAGTPVDPNGFDDASAYRVSSSDDGNFASPAAPTSVSRITRPTGLARTVEGDVETTGNQLFLRLAHPLREGASYTVTLPGASVAPATFTFSDRRTRSPAVHVDQVGFAPNDPVKVGYLSTWTGAAGGITYDPLPTFAVVDATSGAVAAEGTATLRRVPGDGELHRADLTGAPVYQLDFSSLSTPGSYRVCVAGIGCSYGFRIDLSSTWLHTTVQVARAMYQQRSGVELGAAYTTITRPRVFNPADGQIVARQSKLTILEAGGPSQSDRYDKLAAAGTDERVPDAWGGHFDAGDWDRHIDHLLYLRSAIDLVELYPDLFAHLDLQIPESGDKVPDLIDEGLWDLDLFRRLQTADGGIRGGIEQEADPPERAASWIDTQKVWVYAPDPRSSYVYAGVAAQAAQALQAFDPTRAKGYADSATRAFAWAEKHRESAPAADTPSVTDQRLIALAALFRLTDDARYQAEFLTAAPWPHGPVDLLGCIDGSICDAAWIYARTDHPDVDPQTHANVLTSFRNNADALVALNDTTAFGWNLEHPNVPLVWGLGPGTPKITGLMRAWALFHDERYRGAAIRDAAFSLGGNPIDTVMVTGMGSNPARHPLIVDVNNGGLPVWPGTPLYGFHQLGGGDSWVTTYFLAPAGTTPPGAEVPYLWQWFDLSNVAMFSEFTVFQSHAVALFGFGSLAGAASTTR